LVRIPCRSASSKVFGFFVSGINGRGTPFLAVGAGLKTAFAARRIAARSGDQLMNSRITVAGIIFGALLLSSVAAMAAGVPTRGASKNGVNSSQPQMDLFGPTQPQSQSGGDVGVSTQVICPNQDVAGASFSDTTVFPGDTASYKKSGSCLSGLTKFLFQVQPTANLKNLTVTISGLVGFVPGTDPAVDFNNPTYGVQICDDGGNTLELCTSLTADQLPAISTVINAKTNKVTFTIKKLTPTTAPQGVDYEGQGLTFEVITQQTPGTPIAVPKFNVN
jgi:hypothetical protein